MEQYYYNRMNKIEQAVYHALYQGFLNIDEEIQIPRLEGEALYNVFFKLRLDHPEIFWATGYKYKYYNDSPNLFFPSGTRKNIYTTFYVKVYIMIS